MTTQVVISSPKPNHQLVRVSVLDAGGAVRGHVVLDEGESLTWFLYPGRTLVVSEEARPIDG